jgi:hypothetical protein
MVKARIINFGRILLKIFLFMIAVSATMSALAGEWVQVAMYLIVIVPYLFWVGYKGYKASPTPSTT